MNKAIKKNYKSKFNLNDDSIKLILHHNINFIDFKNWYLKNRNKIENSDYLTKAEESFRSWIINPNKNITKLILFYKTHRKIKLIFKMFK